MTRRSQHAAVVFRDYATKGSAIRRGMDNKRVVVVYRDILLPPSETFVLNQAEALENYTPYYVGIALEKGGLLPPMDRTLTVDPDWRGGPVFSQGVQEVGRLNPVLVHAHFGICGAQVLPLTRALKVPLVVTFHGMDATMKDEHLWSLSPKTKVYVRRKDELKRKAALFIAVSKFIREKLLEQGFPPNKIVVHYNGVDTKVFQPNPAVPREPVVLFVGRLVEKKGCEYLIRAMSKVQSIMPKAELVVIGDGPLGSSLKRLAQEKLYRYRFLGVQPPHVVRSWMNRAYLLCAPSITASSGASEGMPTVVLEAQAMGLPVVGTFHSGIPEAVAHGKTGFLTAERDWEGLAEHILLLLKNYTLWHRFSLAAQSRARALFDLHKQTSVLEALYTQLLNTKGVHSAMCTMNLDRLEEYKTTVMRLFPLFPRRLVDAYSINNDDAITLTRFLDCYPQEPVIALEVGTFIGVSAFHLANQPKVSEVVCIDRNQSLADLGKSLAIEQGDEYQLGPGASPSVGVLDVAEAGLARFPEQWRKVRLITGTTGSVPVPTPTNGASLVAFVDGDHSKEGVENDLRAIFEKNPYAVAILHDCVDARNGPAILSGVAAFIEASRVGYRFRLFKQWDTHPQQPNLGVLYPETVADQLEQSARELLDDSTSALFRVSYLRWEASLKQQNQAKQLRKEAEQQLRLEKQNHAKQLREAKQNHAKQLREAKQNHAKQLREAKQQLRLERTKALKIRRENQRMRQRLHNLQGQLESIRASRTWKLVKVLHRIKSMFNWGYQ